MKIVFSTATENVESVNFEQANFDFYFNQPSQYQKRFYGNSIIDNSVIVFLEDNAGETLAVKAVDEDEATIIEFDGCHLQSLNVDAKNLRMTVELRGIQV